MLKAQNFQVVLVCDSNPIIFFVKFSKLLLTVLQLSIQYLHWIALKNPGVCIQTWLSKWETNIVALAKPWTILANQRGASGAQKGGV